MKLSKLQLAAVLAIVLFGLGAALPMLISSAHESGPHLRIAHLAPTAPAVDVYINGELVFDALIYKDVTEYKSIEGHELSVVIVPAGGKLSDSVTKEPIALEFKEGDTGFYTVAAVGSLKDETFAVILLPADGPETSHEEESHSEATPAK